MKGLPVKAQGVTKKEMGALARASVFKSLKKAVNLDLLVKAVAVQSLKKARPTPNKEGSVLVGVPAMRFTLT